MGRPRCGLWRSACVSLGVATVWEQCPSAALGLGQHQPDRPTNTDRIYSHGTPNTLPSLKTCSGSWFSYSKEAPHFGGLSGYTLLIAHNCSRAQLIYRSSSTPIPPSLPTMPPRVREPQAPSIKETLRAQEEIDRWMYETINHTEVKENQAKTMGMEVTPPDQVIRPYAGTPTSASSSVRLSPINSWAEPVVSSLQPEKPKRASDDIVCFLGEPTQPPPKRGRVD